MLIISDIDRKVILSEKCVCVLQEYLGTVQDYEGDAVFISRKKQKDFSDQGVFTGEKVSSFPVIPYKG